MPTSPKRLAMIAGVVYLLVGIFGGVKPTAGQGA
jgi:hypothetical protein